MRCSQAEREYGEFLDGRLSAARAAGLEAHLAACRRCREETHLLRNSLGILDRVAPVSPPTDLWGRLQSRILTEENAAGSALDCRAASRQLPGYLEDALPIVDRRALAQHLAACAGCAAEERDYRASLELLEGVRPGTPPADLWDGVMARLSRATERGGTPDAARRRAWWPAAGLAAAAAAIVLAWAITPPPSPGPAPVITGAKPPMLASNSVAAGVHPAVPGQDVAPRSAAGGTVTRDTAAVRAKAPRRVSRSSAGLERRSPARPAVLPASPAAAPPVILVTGASPELQEVALRLGDLGESFEMAPTFGESLGGASVGSGDVH